MAYNYNISELENEVVKYLGDNDSGFKGIDIAEFLVKKLSISDEDMDGFLAELSDIISEYPYFYDEETQSYVNKYDFFNGLEIRINPTKFEIDNGILMPGHRFFPFCCESVFPSELKLTDNSTGSEVELKEFEIPIQDAVNYYILLGAEELFHYFIADHMTNNEIVSRGNPNEKVTLTVYSFQEFYKRNDFNENDSIIFKIEDWDNGYFSFRVEKSNDEELSKQKEWLEEFDAVLKKLVTDKKINYSSISDMIALAYFRGNRDVLFQPYMSIDQYMSDTDEIEMTVFEGMSILRSTEELEENVFPAAESNDIDESMFSISQGNISSIDGLLKDIGCYMTAIEIDTFILNEMFQGGESIEPIVDRIVYFKQGKFTDDIQEAVLLNYLDDRWELLEEKYRRHADQEKGEIRLKIIQVLENRLHFFNNNSIKIDDLPEYQKKVIETNVENMGHLLKQINSDFSIEDSEFEKILDGIEKFDALQETLFDDIAKELGTNE